MNAKRLFFYPFPIYFAKTSHNNRPVVTTMCPSYLGGASLDFALIIMQTHSCYRLKKWGELRLFKNYYRSHGRIRPQKEAARSIVTI